jgi:hypothetical protein
LCKAPVLSMLEFRKSFSELLIKRAQELRSASEISPRNTRKRRLTDHTKLSMPQFRTWQNQKFVTVNTQWTQRKCVNCISRTRNYCACNPGRALCDPCFVEHVLEVDCGRHGDD